MDLSAEEIRRAGSGDRSSQEKVYNLLMHPLSRLILKMVGPADAEDVTQEIFVNIFQKLKSFHFESKLETWAYRLAVNDCLQYLRRSRRKRTVPLDDSTMMDLSSSALNSTTDSFDVKDLLDIALSRIDAEMRVVLLLKEVDRLSYEAIAEILTIPVGTVGSRLNRARRELRDQLKQLGWEG